MHGATQQPRQGRSRFVEFSLRSLLFLMLISSVGVGWLGYQFRLARRQASIVQDVLDAGVAVQYAHQYRGTARPAGLDWTRRLLGEQLFNQVYALHATKFVTAELLSNIQHLTALNRAHLNNTQTLEQLASLSKLRRLDVTGTDQTNSTIAGLRATPKLLHPLCR